MQRTFLQAKKYLLEQFAEEKLTVTGSNYPIPQTIQLCLNLMQLLQLFSMAAAIFGDSIWSWVRVTNPPALYHACKEWSMLYFVMVFLVIPKFFNQWVITGAFEMYLDDALVYSKLETGSMPSADDLTGPLVRAGLQQLTKEA